MPRRQREAEARAKDEESLRKHLWETARRRKDARDVQAFLRAIHEAVPPNERSDSLRAWLEWGGKQAAELDPLTQPGAIARPPLHPGASAT
jgi:hypothetical protein